MQKLRGRRLDLSRVHTAFLNYVHMEQGFSANKHCELGSRAHHVALVWHPQKSIFGRNMRAHLVRGRQGLLADM